ncbi:MAG: hypothetical protein QXT73_05210 [Candidatus Methanomethylicaceae archaeon]
MPMEYLPATTGALLKQRIGWITTTREYELLLDTNNQRLLENNPRRVAVTFINNGDFRADISTQSTLVAGRGIPIHPGGGTLSILWEEDGTMVSGEFHGKTVTGQVYLKIIEVVLL